MNLVFNWKKTFGRAFKVFFPMVMAAEPGRSGSELEEYSSLSITSETNVPNTRMCTITNNSIPAESRNGMMAQGKLPHNEVHSVEDNKHEDYSEMQDDSMSHNGQIYSRVIDKYISEDDSSNNNLKSDVSPSHRDQLLLLHLDLIGRQQQLIQTKDKEILQLTAEKEQLEGRIKRMERRMAIKMQHSHEEDDIDILSLPRSTRDSKILQNRMNRKPSMSERMRRKSIPAAAPVLISSTIEGSVNIDTCLRTENLYMNNEDSMIAENFDKTIQEKSEHSLVTDDVPTPQFRIVENYSFPLQTCETTTRLDSVGSESDIDTTSENLDDETFVKRHSRPETDERRRKRWDIQHYRAKRQREELQEKYKQREEARLKGRKIVEPEPKSCDETLLPDCFHLETVEMSDSVPVAAFGAPVQPFEESEFGLAWFNVDKRELQEREKLLRSKARNRRKSGRKFCKLSWT